MPSGLLQVRRGGRTEAQRQAHKGAESRTRAHAVNLSRRLKAKPMQSLAFNQLLWTELLCQSRMVTAGAAWHS